jgi:hypothetical protein
MEEKLIGEAYVPRTFVPQTASVVAVTDDGQMLIRYNDGYLETLEIPIERVPECRKLIDPRSHAWSKTG